MRFFIFLIGFLVLNACCTPIHSDPTSELEQISQTEQLVRYSLSDRLLSNVRQRTQAQLHSMLLAKSIAPQDAQRIEDEELAAVISIEERRLLDRVVPVFRRYYTADEINQLLSFYQTEVARKSQTVSGQIAAEVQPYVQRWNGNFEESLLERISARIVEEGLISDK